MLDSSAGFVIRHSPSKLAGDTETKIKSTALKVAETAVIFWCAV